MRIPGDSRSKGDRSVTVRCQCGVDVLTLPAGQVLAVPSAGDGSSPVSIECKACGRPMTLHVKPTASPASPATSEAQGAS